MSEAAIVTQEIRREVVETDGETITLETPLLGPQGPPGKDGGEGLAEEIEARQEADIALGAEASAAQATADAALPKSGGTMTGPLTLAGDPAANLQAATRQYVQVQLAALIDGAPSALDTLKELADKLGSEETAIEALAAVVTGKLSAASNLSDLVDAIAARSNLGLGSAATHPSGDFQAADPDLSAIAALPTTEAGRALLTKVSIQAIREYLTVPKILVGAKASDQPLAKESTALQSLTELVPEIGTSATEKWLVEWWLSLNAANITMDLKVGFAALPAGASITWAPMSSPAGSAGWQASSTTVTAGLALGGGNIMQIGSREGNFLLGVAAIVQGGGTEGSIQIQAAQNTSDPGALKVLTGSLFKATRVAV